MQHHAPQLPALVTVERERYLRQNETKIRSAASNALAASAKPDVPVSAALNALIYAEDLADRHEIAVAANRKQQREPMARDHERYVAMATHLKIRALDQLSHLVGH